MSTTFVMDEEACRLVGDARVIMPATRRNAWTRSRLVALPDGPVPLLYLLATAKFGQWDPKEKFPYWKDRNWTNESIENVALMDETVSTGAKGRMSQFGVPSGTKEYRKLYREKHKERLNTYQRTRYKGMMELKRKYVTGEITHKMKMPEPVENSMGSRLDEILSAVKTGKP